MNKVTGIKSVDLKISASGNGVVNYNGSVSVVGPKGMEINNHMMPKLRGYTNETGKIKEDTGYRFKKTASEVNFTENPLYISQNCIRHHLFKDQSYDFHFANKKGSNNDPKHLLLSISGLLRGFVVPSTQCKRKSPLLIEDFVDHLGNGNFEQLGNSGAKDSNSIFSKTTFGETSYSAFASISIEELQFISLDKKFDREAYVLKNEKEGIALAEELTTLLKDFDPSFEGKPAAVFGEYYRKGSIYKETEFGILLNQDAIKLLIALMIELIEDLSINQAKGWMSVDRIEIDYNASGSMMRIKKNPDTVEDEQDSDFAIYYVKAGE